MIIFARCGPPVILVQMLSLFGLAWQKGNDYSNLSRVEGNKRGKNVSAHDNYLGLGFIINYI